MTKFYIKINDIVNRSNDIVTHAHMFIGLYFYTGLIMITISIYQNSILLLLENVLMLSAILKKLVN
jgi:hypothetical protein